MAKGKVKAAVVETVEVFEEIGEEITTLPAEEVVSEEVIEVGIEELTDRELLEEILLGINALAKMKVSVTTLPKVEGPTQKASKALSPEQKRVKKADLLEKGPYSEAALVTMPFRDRKMYASALLLPKDQTFGKSTEVLIANILAAQKRQAK